MTCCGITDVTLLLQAVTYANHQTLIIYNFICQFFKEKQMNFD